MERIKNEVLEILNRKISNRVACIGDKFITLSENEVDLGDSPQGSNWTLENLKSNLRRDSGVRPSVDENEIEADKLLASKLVGFRVVNFQEGPYSFDKLIGILENE